METRKAIGSAIWVALLVCAVVAGCRETGERASGSGREAPKVVTADIQAGIEKHISDESAAHGGYFEVPWKDGVMRMKLVRVHTEYLANLGPRRHFACVDLVDTEGDVYDVDFFLAGDPGSMRVTETTVHKVNGQPLYYWEQQDDGTWARVKPDPVPDALAGVIRGRDRFEFIYQAKLPEIRGAARMWVPLAQTGRWQTVSVKSMDVPGERKVVKDKEHGNKILYVELGPEASGKTLEIRYDVEREEKSAYAAEEPAPGKYLHPERLVPVNETFGSIATRVTAGKEGELVRARAIYDHTIDRMRYMKYGKGWGQGDAVYACDARTGNCTDFHAYFIAVSRAAGIPARFAIGAGIPSHRNDGGVDGYHCWAEFYAEGKWWPVDISEADKYSSLATYYFGHHPANRVELSRGRDLKVEPAPASGPINFLAYPLLEVEGEPVRPKVTFLFERPVRSAGR
jgi:transglutaminase-like putative cysteine protease